MKHSSPPIANPLVVLREEFDNWAILFNPDTGDAVGINPVGVAIWKILDGQNPMEHIVEAIRNQFSQVPEQVTKEAAAFVDHLARLGYVGYEFVGKDTDDPSP